MKIMVNSQFMLILWVLFFSVSALSSRVDDYVLQKSIDLDIGKHWFFVISSVPIIICVIIATIILRRTGIKPLPVTGVVLGFLLGQWYYITFMIITIGWATGKPC
jgi:hypothetical protein